MHTALYALSGDPITFGHLNIIQRISSLFPRVIIAVGDNPEKQYLFDKTERTALITHAIKKYNNTEVQSFRGLLIDFAYEQNASVIIKGIRDSHDFHYENTLFSANESQEIGIETFFLFAKNTKQHISSSMAKSLVKEQGFINQYVPIHVKTALEKKILKQTIIGITGETGVGKTYTAKQLLKKSQEKNIPLSVINLDHIGHEITNHLHSQTYINIRNTLGETFGKHILQPDGFVDRKQLGAIVFQDEEKRKQLNTILKRPILTRLKHHLRGKQGIILIDAALFAEIHLEYLCNNTFVLIHTSQQLQEKHLSERQLSPEQIRIRKRSQYDFQEKKKTLTETIKKDNYGELIEFNNDYLHTEPNFDQLFESLENIHMRIF